MERKRIELNPDSIPTIFHPLLRNAVIYDSSCSRAAQVVFIDKDSGYYLKSAPSGALEKEAEMTRFFHKKKLAAQVLAYVRNEKDWLLTERVPGEDCINPAYLENPKKLCETLAVLLRQLHQADAAGCPVPNRTEDYLATAAHNYRAGIFHQSRFTDNWGEPSAEAAWRIVKEYAHLLKADTLIHGDYCLPNIILNDWRFSGFIDLGCGGVGERHVDLFWGIWSLYFNLKTNRYQERFLDAYGRTDVNPEILRLIAAIKQFR